MPEQFDVIIIGSGPAGTSAAVPLVEAGLNVLMLDGGHTSSTTQQESPATFEDVRRNDPNQWKTFLGEDLSSIPVGGLEGGLGGGMVSGNRSFVTRDTPALLPTEVKNGLVMQSLAKGGLGAVWGAACAFFSTENLEAMGLPAEDIQKHYDSVARRIGISGPVTRPCIQPPMPLDHHAENVQTLANHKRRVLERMKIRITQPHSAVLTQDMGSRKATSLTDMDYYNDPGRSIYRPQYTVDELMARPNFHYQGGVVVKRVEETPEGTVVFGHTVTDALTMQRWTAKRVIVAAGAVNTARILLASFNLYEMPVPFVAKPHVYTACLQPYILGKAGPERRSSLCQLLVIDESKTTDGFESGCAQLYSYRSLLLFRLLGNIPYLPVPETMGILSLLSPALVVADIRFPATAADGHTLTLRRGIGKPDYLVINCNDDRTSERRLSLKRMHKAMRKTGLWPVKTSAMPPASTSHHAGTIPVESPTAPLTVTRDGLLTRSKTIYVADASMFRSIPALPYTLTIMANAERIGTIVRNSL